MTTICTPNNVPLTVSQASELDLSHGYRNRWASERGTSHLRAAEQTRPLRLGPLRSVPGAQGCLGGAEVDHVFLDEPGLPRGQRHSQSVQAINCVRNDLAARFDRTVPLRLRQEVGNGRRLRNLLHSWYAAGGDLFAAYYNLCSAWVTRGTGGLLRTSVTTSTPTPATRPRRTNQMGAIKQIALGQ